MRVAILGCGYVGLELARQLGSAHDVVGVRRSTSGLDAVADAGADPVQADVTDPESLAAVPDVDAVVFAASSGGRDAEAARSVYVEGLRTVVEAFGARDSPPDRLVYTSSTGVYGDHDGDWVDEDTPLSPTTAKTRVLVEADRLARELPAAYGIDGGVARFAGLYGPDRYRLDRYLEGPVTEGYLNLIHREDAAGVLGFMLESTDATVLVAVDDEPVDKWTFADWLADECGVDPPPKLTRAERLSGDLGEATRRRIQASKRCSNDCLRALGYAFRYPTFRAGYRAAIADRS